jgi:hypothetical protein
MKNINFLPDYYRQRNELRQARLWWGICAAVFGAVIAITVVTQWSLKQGVKTQLALVEPLYQAARNHDQKFVGLQTQVQQQGEAAALFVYLQHPWRRSQILAAVVKELPPTITLSALDLKLEAKAPVAAEATSSTRKRSAANSAEDAKNKGKTAEQRDLTKLREEFDAQNTIVEVRGTTTDDSQLHGYVSKLTEHPLVASVRLQSIESISIDSKPKSRFVVRMQLKPGYGQPNGPEIPEPTAKSKAMPKPVEQSGQPSRDANNRFAHADINPATGAQP